nr:hypothetical protein [Tanacetum cinerariifolium]
VCLVVIPARWLQKVRRSWSFLSLICTFILLSLPPGIGKAVEEYSIPLDLHPRLPPPGMTMNKLSSRYIGLYIEQLEQGDRRVVPDAMPWRHGDTDLHDDFSENYNENDAARLSEFLVPLRPPPRHLLYVCGLTMACRHPKLHYNIKDQVQNVIDMDMFLKLPTWTGTVVGRGDPIPEDQRPKSWVTPSREAKRAGAKGAEGPKKRRKVQKHNESIQEVVDLSGNTRVPTLPAVANQPSPHIEHHDNHENKSFDAHSSQSSHQGNEDEPVDHRYVPNWVLCDDVRVCTFHACRELISHLAIPAEDEFSGNLSNVENRNDAYSVELKHLRSSLMRENQDNDGLTNKLTLLESAHSECSSREKELLDMVKDLEGERDEWRTTASDEVEKIRRLKKDLEPRTQQLMVVEEKIRVLERDKLALSAEVAQAEADLKKLVREFRHVVVKRLHTSVEYRKSLAFPVAKHRELFTIPYPYIQKFADSYDLSMSELLEVSPNVPPLSKDGDASFNAAAGGAT